MAWFCLRIISCGFNNWMVWHLAAGKRAVIAKIWGMGWEQSILSRWIHSHLCQSQRWEKIQQRHHTCCCCCCCCSGNTPQWLHPPSPQGNIFMPTNLPHPLILYFNQSIYNTTSSTAHFFLCRNLGFAAVSEMLFITVVLYTHRLELVLFSFFCNII